MLTASVNASPAAAGRVVGGVSAGDFGDKALGDGRVRVLVGRGNVAWRPDEAREEVVHVAVVACAQPGVVGGLSWYGEILGEVRGELLDGPEVDFFRVGVQGEVEVAGLSTVDLLDAEPRPHARVGAVNVGGKEAHLLALAVDELPLGELVGAAPGEHPVHARYPDRGHCRHELESALPGPPCGRGRDAVADGDGRDALGKRHQCSWWWRWARMTMRVRWTIRTVMARRTAVRMLRRTAAGQPSGQRVISTV